MTATNSNAAPSAGRRPRRPAAPPVDVSSFADQIDQALIAFGQDVGYAVQMARSAVVIARKRQVGAARRELREAEARAHAECAAAAPFDCHAVSACGTGDCKFAEGEHATLTVAASGGVTTRPQRRTAGTRYSLDEAVTALAAQRLRAA